MSGRFVSGGTISSAGDKDSKDTPASASASAAAAREPLAKKSVEWEAVQRELEEERRKRERARAELAGEGGQQQTLYDILQANKGSFFDSSTSFPHSLFLVFAWCLL